MRVTVRSLLRRPGMFVTSVAILSLGIGANGAMTGVGWAVLFAPIPLPDSDRLFRLFHNDDLTFGVSINELLAYRAGSTSLDDLAGWRILGATHHSSEGPRRVTGAHVTPNFFAVLGGNMSLGASFSADGSLPEVVLSHRFWLEAFGADSNVIGTNPRFDNVPHRVVGVTTPKITFPDASIDYFSPIDLTTPRATGRGGLFLDVLARLAPGLDARTAGSEVRYLAETLRQADPAAYTAEPGFAAHLVPIRDALVSTHRPFFFAMMIGAGLVLLATGLNVSTLLLSHVESRTRTIAIRRAIGASPTDVMRFHAMEGVLIATAGAVGAGLLGTWVTDFLSGFMPLDVGAGLAGTRTYVVIAVATGAIAAAVLFATIPIPAILRTVGLPAQSYATVTPGRASIVMRLLQTSVAVMLVSGALLLTQTTRNLATTDLGYRKNDVLTARISLPASRYASNTEINAFFSNLLTVTAAIPGVHTVAIVNALPLTGIGGGGDVYLEAANPDSAVDVIAHRLASPGYFSAMGIPILAGRDLSDIDRQGAPRVAVVDENFATRFFGRPVNAVGQRLRSFFGGEEWNEIVGVVGSVRHTGPHIAARPMAYYPIAQRPTRSAYIVLHGRVDADAAARHVRQTTTTLDATLPVYDIATMQTRLSAVLARDRFTLLLFGAFALLSVALAIIGIYGAVQLAQERRVREIGIRRALGAPAGNVVWVTIRHTLFTTGIGATIGIGGAWIIGGVLESLLFGVTGRNPLVLGGAMGLMMAAGSVAAFVPGVAALRTELVTLLRPEST